MSEFPIWLFIVWAFCVVLLSWVVWMLIKLCVLYIGFRFTMRRSIGYGKNLKSKFGIDAAQAYMKSQPITFTEYMLGRN